jgi:hypothetical protein
VASSIEPPRREDREDFTGLTQSHRTEKPQITQMNADSITIGSVNLRYEFLCLRASVVNAMARFVPGFVPSWL